MITTQLSRFVQAIVLATVVAALAAPAAALGGSRSGPGLHDGWYTYAESLAGPAETSTVDGRSPDTLEAANGGPRTIEYVRPGGFDWADAGIGAIIATLALIVTGGSLLLLARFNRRQRVRVT